MWPLRMPRATLRIFRTFCLGSLCLLVVVCGSIVLDDPHVIPLVSTCKQYTMPYELLINKYTLIRIHDRPISTALNCSLQLKTFTHNAIHIKLLAPHPSPAARHCSALLTLIEPMAKNKLLNSSQCVLPAASALSLETASNIVIVGFTLTPSSSSLVGAALLFTVIHRDCRSTLHFRCTPKGTCVDKALRCDNIPHCPNGEDEHDCNLIVTVGPPTTPLPLGSTLAPEMVESIYLWLPLIVVIIFTIVMLALVLVGRRATRCSGEQHYRQASTSGFPDNGPPTPPPTYSMIERQTSYVSHISQTSSQISVPPTYEDTVPEEEDPRSWLRRLRRHLSRSTSVTAIPARTRRFFQRSLSAHDPPAAARGRPEGGRLRRASDRTARPNTNINTNINTDTNLASPVSDTDSVFQYSPRPRFFNPEAGDPNPPSLLDNVSEADETLGSSLMLIGQPARDVTPADDVTSGGAPRLAAAQIASQKPSALSRVPLQRSISDVIVRQGAYSFED